MPQPFKYHFLIFICSFFFLDEAFPQISLPPFYEIKSDTITQQDLDSRFWQVLPDSMGTLTIKDVRNESYSSKFIPITATNSSALKVVETNWLRFRLKNVMDGIAEISLSSTAAQADFYVFNRTGIMQHFRTGQILEWSKRDGLKKENQVPIILSPGEEITVYQRRYNVPPDSLQNYFKIRLFSSKKSLGKAIKDYEINFTEIPSIYAGFFSGLFFLASIFNFLIFWQIKDKVYLFFSLFLFFISIQFHPALHSLNILDNIKAVNFFIAIGNFWLVFFLFFVRQHFEIYKYYKNWSTFLLLFSFIYALLIVISACFFKLNFNVYFSTARNIVTIVYLICLGITVLIGLWKPGELRRIFLYSMSPFVFGLFLLILILLFFFKGSNIDLDPNVLSYIIGGCIAWAVIVFSSYLFKKYGQQQKQILQEQLEKERILIEKERERNEFIAEQKVELEKQVTDRTSELKQSLEELKAAQTQLIQSEKMAGLGELTAGIAHEIQNPLNFVNNFSEVSRELIAEMNDELNVGNIKLAKELAIDIEQNLGKINHHGKRAGDIVRAMLQHSRSNNGIKEPTDINVLVDEYLRLAYHGLRAKDKSFNAVLKTNFSDKIGTINIIPQDIGRVILNLITNAFYAIKNQSSINSDGVYEPTVSVSTRQIDGKVEIEIADNGNGISEKVLGKIFQPFFTTKPTGQGTGLGLSLSYDIVKAHGGDIIVNTQPGKGAVFIVQLPVFYQ